MTAQPLPEENVQSYPRPPALQPVGVEVIVTLGGVEILRSQKALRILETHHAPTYYLPREAILAETLEVPGTSWCEWKGQARYWTLRAGGVTAPRSAWDYPRPDRRYAALAGHLAIYAQAMDRITVGGLVVTPQPGDFYGGWVTSNLTGLVKGGPGTRHW